MLLSNSMILVTVLDIVNHNWCRKIDCFSQESSPNSFNQRIIDWEALQLLNNNCE